MADAEQFVQVIFGLKKTNMDLPVWPEQRTDLKLQIAENEAIQSGVLTPLLKEELWTKIQHSRLERGLDELKVEVKTPVKTPLTNEEETKVATRREKNRQAAVRCRQKRKSKQKELEIILEKETERNNSLRTLHQRLQNEKDLLMAQLGLAPISPPEEPARVWTPPLKEEPTCSWTPSPHESASAWTPMSSPWYTAPTPTPPPTDTPPKCWTFSTTPQWIQQVREDESPSPPPPECFSYWQEDELQVVPGEGCSNLHLS